MKAHSETLTPLAHSAQNRCFGCGTANPTGLRLEFMLAQDGTVVCLASIPETFEGPRGFVHGGIIATLLDEAMSKLNRPLNVLAMTRHMEVDYLRPVPLYQPLVLVARHHSRPTKSDGTPDRKLFHQAEIQRPDGTVLARAKGVFIALDEKILAAAGFTTPQP